MAVNHLKNRDAQRKIIDIAFGRIAVGGDLCFSKYDGVNVIAWNALGEGEWNVCKSAFYKGEEIPATDYDFQPGALATAMTTGPQKVNSFFSLDVPHSRTAGIGYKIPSGLAETDTNKTPPTDFKGIFETKKCPNFNSSGVQTGFAYSVNPANQILELLLAYARMPNLPSSYASAAAYWLGKIDFGNWCDFRDFHEQTETVDYTTIADFRGFGLTASYYDGTNFNSFVSKFVHPNFDIDYGTQPPAPGIATDNFSGRFEGKIKFEFSETYTFTITHDNGAKLWVNGTQIINSWQDDGQLIPTTSTATFAATAGTFYDIKIEWNNGGGPGNLLVEWSSASRAIEVIPSAFLYPKAESQKLYEFHGFFSTAISPGAAIRIILYQTNSFMQMVNGKFRFYAYEQLTPSFTFQEGSSGNIDSFEFRRRDILKADPFTEYEAQMNDLDSQYLEEPSTPVSIQLETFARKSFEKVNVINLYNTTKWRALKVLKLRGKLETADNLLADLGSTMAKSYPVVSGDLISVTHRKLGSTARNFLVKQAVDVGIGESAAAQGTEIEKRKFTLQEYS